MKDYASELAGDIVDSLALAQLLKPHLSGKVGAADDFLRFTRNATPRERSSRPFKKIYDLLRVVGEISQRQQDQTAKITQVDALNVPENPLQVISGTVIHGFPSQEKTGSLAP